jgi:WD40 repeat protein
MTNQTIKLFVSSPSDVLAEREEVSHVVSRLESEFEGIDFDVIRWEEGWYSAREGFQEQIAAPDKCDLVLLIVWKRLGSALPDSFSRNDGSSRTGTEYEFEVAMEAALKGNLPDILVYRKTEKILFEADRVEQEKAELQALEGFWRRWLRNEKGHFTGAFKSFDTTEVFASQLVKDLRAWLNDQDDNIAWPESKGSPFRGLDVFDEQHASIFFGRKRATQELRAKLLANANKDNAQNFMVVVGSSGSGKSSLVRAGLLPMLMKQGYIAKSLTLMPTQLGTDVLADLAQKLFTLLPELKDSDCETYSELATYFKQAPELSAKPIEGAIKRSTIKTEQYVLLFIDQLEEVFQWPEQVRDLFMSVVQGLASSARLMIVATLRSDFYPQLITDHRLKTLSDNGHLYNLAPIRETELQEVIQGPVKAAGLHFEMLEDGSTLDQRLLDEAQSESNVLPLLEFTLEQLYQERDQSQQQLTFSVYERLGGLTKALGEQAEKTLQSIASGEALFVDAMRKLITINLEGDVTRRRTPLSEFTAAELSFVNAMTNARLLATEGEELPTVSLAHEALLSAWARIPQWLEKDNEFLRWHARAEREATQWLNENKLKGRLLPKGKPLVDAENFLAERQPDIADGLQTYIQESIAHHRRKRLVLLSMAASVILALSSLTGYSLLQKQAAEISENKAQAALAVSFGAQGDSYQVKGEMNKALLYYKESLKRKPLGDIENKARLLLSQMPIATAEASTGIDSFWGIDEIPNNGDVFIGSRDGGFYIASKGAQGEFQFNHHKTGTANVTSYASIKDQSLFYVGDSEGDIWSVNVTDASGTKVKRLFSGPNKSIRSMALHPDGQQLALGYADGKATLYSLLDSSESALSADGLTGAIFDLNFSKNGQQLFAVGNNKKLFTFMGDQFTESSAEVLGASTGRRVMIQDERILLLTEDALISRSLDGLVTLDTVQMPEGFGAASMQVVADKIYLGSYTGELLGIDANKFVVDKRIKLSNSWVMGMAPFDEQLMVFDTNGSIWVVNPNSLSIEQKTKGRTGIPSHMLVNGAELLVADGVNIHRYNLSDLEVKQSKEGHVSNILSVALSDSGQLLATGSNNNTVKIWDAATLSERLVLRKIQRNASLLRFAGESQLLVGDDDGALSLWNIATGEMLHRTQLHLSKVVGIEVLQRQDDYSHWGADSPIVISTGKNGKISISDLETGVHLRSIQSSGATWRLAASALSASKQEVAVAVSEGRGHVCIFDVYDFDNTEFSVSEACLALNSDAIATLTTKGDGWLAGSNGGELIEFNRNAVLATYPLHEAGIKSAVWSQSNKTLISSSSDTRLKSWKLPIIDQQVFPDSIESIDGDLYQSVVMDDQVVIAGGPRADKVFSLDRNEPSGAFMAHYFTADGVTEKQFYALALNDEFLAMGGQGGYLVLEDRATGERLFPDITDSYLIRLAFSKSTSNLLAGFGDGDFAIYDSTNIRNAPRLFSKHESKIVALASFPNEGKVLSADVDGHLFVWDETTREVLQTYKSAVGLGGAAIDNAGEYIAVGRSDGSVLFYPADSFNKASLLWEASPLENIVDIQFSKDDNTLIVLGSGAWAMLDTQSGKTIATGENTNNGTYLRATVSGNQMLLTGTKGLYETIVIPDVSATVNLDLINTIKHTAALVLNKDQTISEAPHKVRVQSVSGGAK